jgi:spore coat protein U-like protein
MTLGSGAVKLLAGVFATSVAFMSPVQAADIGNVRTMNIAVNGAVREQCALGKIADMDFGDLERRGLSAEARVELECNLPFTMTIRGQKGALTHTGLPNGQSPYGGAVPYSFAVQVPVRFPSLQTISRNFDSRQLQAGGVISSNGGIATDGMVLAVELGRPSGEAGLLAGDYSETITITISPA